MSGEKNPRNSRAVIRASDLASYAYCARAWWLGAVLGAPSRNAPEMQRGEWAHRAHGRRVWLSRALAVAAVALMLAAALVLLLSNP